MECCKLDTKILIPDGSDEDDIGRNIKRFFVLFNDAPIADFMSKQQPKVIFEYTVEIYPPNLVETPVKSTRYHRIPDLNCPDFHGSRSSLNDSHYLCKCNKLTSRYKYCLFFDGFTDFDKEGGFCVTVSTELGGVTVTQMTVTEATCSNPKEDEDGEKAKLRLRKRTSRDREMTLLISEDNNIWLKESESKGPL